jgi:long-subunit fatty acid transport protein
MLKSKDVKGAVLFSAAVLLAGAAQAQGLGNSPYSRLGLGDYNPNTGGVRQMGMGGVGLAAPNAVNINELNPALLYFVPRTTFEAGYTGQYKTVKNAKASGRTGSGTLGYLSLAVPLSSKWGAAIGLKPFSSVDYESTVVEAVENGPASSLALKQRKGSGGISEAYFAQGYHITKSLSVGVTASYLFGSIDQNNATTVQTDGNAVLESAVIRDHTHYSDFAFRAGIHYRQKLSKDLRLNLAGVYSFQSKLGGQRDSTQELQDANGSTTGVVLATRSSDGSTTLPALAQFGISLDNDKNWSANLDVSHQKWSGFQSFGKTESAFQDTWRLGVGGEFTPDPGSVEHYFRRVTYRVGVNVGQMPYQFGGQTLYDRSVSWGFAFPMPTATPLEATTFSLAFTYGMRGNTDILNSSTGSSNVQENYLRAQLGVTLNNRWFLKRRLQ